MTTCSRQSPSSPSPTSACTGVATPRPCRISLCTTTWSSTCGASSRRASAPLLSAGVAPEHLAVDPGIGFAKTGDHNWALLAALDEIAALGFPLVVGASRKAFLGPLLADECRRTPASRRA